VSDRYTLANHAVGYDGVVLPRNHDEEKDFKGETLSVACNRASKVANITGQTTFVYDGVWDGGKRFFVVIPASRVELSDLDRILAVIQPSGPEAT